MTSKAQRRAWFDVTLALASVLDDSALPMCPAYGKQRVDYMYVGDPATRIGFLVVWCDACRLGARMSRAQAPLGAHFMTFSDETFAERVPNFTEVPLER